MRTVQGVPLNGLISIAGKKIARFSVRSRSIFNSRMTVERERTQTDGRPLSSLGTKQTSEWFPNEASSPLDQRASFDNYLFLPPFVIWPSPFLLAPPIPEVPDVMPLGAAPLFIGREFVDPGFVPPGVLVGSADSPVTAAPPLPWLD